MKLTQRDLPEDVERFEKELPTKKPLGQDEIAAIRACFDLPTFEHIRDRAIFEIHMATAFRFDTVRAVPQAALNEITEVITEGGKVMQGKIDGKALAHVRTYLRLRPDTDSPALFVTDAGKPLSYHGGRMIWRRIRKRSGIKRLGSHLIRHSCGQGMARAGASIADIQDVLGHESDKMARHQAGEARKFAAAELMTKYSLAG